MHSRQRFAGHYCDRHRCVAAPENRYIPLDLAGEMETDVNVCVRKIGKVKKGVHWVDRSTVRAEAGVPYCPIGGVFSGQADAIGKLGVTCVTDDSPDVLAIDLEQCFLVVAVDMPAGDVTPEAVVVFRM